MDLPSTVRVSALTRELIEKRELLQEYRPTEVTSPEVLRSHPIGSRCEVAPGKRRGTVRFVGRPGGLQLCVAVELDEMQGDDVHLGGQWLDGVTYFEASRPDAPVVWKALKEVVCGDFPELDPFADLSD
eukprot:symbB.v1.2.034501.t1/scaffold4452.1/size39499/2